MTKYPSFEALTVTCNKIDKCFCIVYRPPNLSVNLFHDEFEKHVDQLQEKTKLDLICVGDVNIWQDQPDLQESRNFSNILERYKLKQHIVEPTHIHQHILDILITDNHIRGRLDYTLNSQIDSDHLGIVFPMSIKKSETNKDEHNPIQKMV